MGERKLFGTDGIRGKANIYPMTCEVAMVLGRAVTHYFQKKLNREKQPLIIVGKDTRLSCYMLEQAFSSGVCSQGGRVILTGPLPTPGVAFVTESMRADAGVMISASHNKYSDNGIKIFDGAGYKLPDSMELELEEMVLNSKLIPSVEGGELGNTTRLDEVIGRYVVQVKSAFPSNYTLEDMRIVIDCANGGGYKVGPMIFEELGAEVLAIGISPNGKNINEGCGSVYTALCREHVSKYRADIGICLDGDADRAIIIDKSGDIIDGDQIIGACATLLLDKGILKRGDEIVGTVMSNLGLERYIESLGLKFVRVKVGDRYIMEYMRNSGALLGGEPSGHLIFKEHATTGDGILSALKVLECIKYYGQPLKEICSKIRLYPNLLNNIVVSKKIPIEENKSISDVVSKANNLLGDTGRILLRYSGTEPLLRVMVEGENLKKVEKALEMISDIVLKELVSE